MSFWKRSCTVVYFGKVAYIPAEEHRKNTFRKKKKQTNKQFQNNKDKGR